MKQVVILAGGKGTRLRDRLGSLPKPLIDICGIPLLERQIILLKKYGFEKILILVSYQAEIIVEFCRSKGNWGIDIQCIPDGKPQGTAGAVLNLFDQLENEFLLMYGDTMLDVDLLRFHEYHSLDKTVAATLFLHPNDHPQDSDLVEVNNMGYITNFYPYPHNTQSFYPNLVNAALYFIRKSALEPWRNFAKGSIDFGKDLFPALIEKGFRLRGYNSPEYIKDCGTPSRIDKVYADFKSGKISRSVLNIKQMAVFMDRDGTINHEVDHLNSVDQFELFPGVEHAIQRLNTSEYRVCIVTNQPVIARGECSSENLRQIHNKLETLLGKEGAFVDRIYYCPHHPDKGFQNEVENLKINCACRKPKTGMIDLAVAELNISLNRSWLIGDSTSDLMMAHNAGIKSILVETGYAGLDEKYWITPDFIVPNLSSAVSLILDKYPILVKLIEPITHKIQSGDIVFIGGQSRSGKSSLSSVFRHILESRKKCCKVISTDCWLLNEHERGNSVLDRHAITEIYDTVMLLNNPASRPANLVIPGYRKSSREHVSNAYTLDLSVNDVIIIEGVVSLYFANLVNAQHKIYVDIDENERKKRVIQEYKIRGLTNKAAEDVYLMRLAEEVPWIASTAKRAEYLFIPVINE